MVQLIAHRARAYVYCGDWVADCPRACGNVEHCYARTNPRDPAGPRVVQLPSFHCSYCKLGSAETVLIDWPPNMAGIMAVLMLRPIPHTRNWYPASHDTALKYRIPHGQSIEDLRAENAAHNVPTEGVA
ncbi:MAG TPA: hypothetical protein VLB29_07355 [Nocardioidaceae bacterium]|nr:hypothetical protein [Nocardioidaceae bacterium]